jgi:hypothetical protein
MRIPWRRALLGLGMLPILVGASGGSSPPPSLPDGCPAWPDGAEPLHGLVSGQALVSEQAVTLRFSSRAFACGEWDTSTVTGGECFDRWSFSLTMSPAAFAPGTHKLAELSTQFGELHVITGPPEEHGCSRASCTIRINGTGSEPVMDPGPALEIFSADDRCVTGRISGFKDSGAGDAPVYSGAFFALRCR